MVVLGIVVEKRAILLIHWEESQQGLETLVDDDRDLRHFFRNLIMPAVDAAVSKPARVAQK